MDYAHEEVADDREKQQATSNKNLYIHAQELSIGKGYSEANWLVHPECGEGSFFLLGEEESTKTWNRFFI